MAFDAKIGTVLWKATIDGASNSSAVIATVAGSKEAIFLTRNGIVALDPASGHVKTQLPWRSRSAASVNVANRW